MLTLSEDTTETKRERRGHNNKKQKTKEFACLHDSGRHEEDNDLVVGVLLGLQDRGQQAGYLLGHGDNRKPGFDEKITRK